MVVILSYDMPIQSQRIHHISWLKHIKNLHFPRIFQGISQALRPAQMLLFELLNGAFLHDDQLAVLDLEKQTTMENSLICTGNMEISHRYVSLPEGDLPKQPFLVE